MRITHYRIKSYYSKANGRIQYMVQAKFKFWPFWIDMRSYNTSEAEAELKIESLKQKAEERYLAKTKTGVCKIIDATTSYEKVEKVDKKDLPLLVGSDLSPAAQELLTKRLKGGENFAYPF